MKYLPSWTLSEVVAAFNEWMRQYTEEPDQFMNDWEVVREFLATEAGQEPTYGQACTAFMGMLIEKARS